MVTSLLLGAGDLGTQIGLELAAGGSDVVAVRRRAALVAEPLTGLACDLTQGADVVRASLEILRSQPNWTNGPDHLVVCLTAGGRDEAAYRATYVDAVGHALGAVRALDWAPRRAVFVSSTAVCAPEGFVDESTPPNPQTPTARVLAEAERSFLEVLPTTTRGIVIRPSGIYGPGREWFVDRVRAGDIGDPARVTHRVHRDDAARAVAHVLTMDSEPDEVYLVTDAAPATAGEVATFLAPRLGVEAQPSWALEAEGSRRLSNARLRGTGFEFRFPTYCEGYADVLDHPRPRHP